MNGSLQLRLYRIARRDGAPRDLAAELSGVGRKEAVFTDADDVRDPPPPSAFVLSAGMARKAAGELAGTPLGDAAIRHWTGASA